MVVIHVLHVATQNARNMQKYYTVQDLIDRLAEVKDKSAYVMIEYHDEVVYRWEHIDSWYENNDPPAFVLQPAGLFNGPLSE